MYFLESSRFTLVHNYNPMIANEERNFDIDKTKKENCRFPSDEITVRKTAWPNEEKRVLKVVGYENDAYVEYFPGYVQQLYARGKTQGCGIATILMKLCLNEESIHNVENNEENRAVTTVKHWAETCKFEDSCKEEDHKELIKTLEEWSSSKCSKMVYLLMQAKPKIGAHVYFNSAIDTGFSQMFIKIKTEEMYPKNGPCSVKTLKGRYNEDGDMVEGEDEVFVYGKPWFFCTPKSPAVESKCQ